MSPRLPNRRRFLVVGGAGLIGTGLASRLTWGQTSQEKEPPFRISLAQWSFHRALQKKTMDHLDFAKATREQFGIEAVEYVNSFFKDKATDEKYLAEMNKRAADHGVKQLLIMCDGEGDLGDAKEAKRLQAVENHHRWVDAAKTLGCHSIRVNAASSGTYEEQVKLAADGLSQLSDYAAKVGLNVIVENHGGLSSNGAWLAQVMKTVGKDNCGTLPDFGNFDLGDGKTYDRYVGVAELMPYAKAVSAKSHDFDSEGTETHTDFMKMMKIVLDAGYRGYVGIEYEGSKFDEPSGIAATKALLEKCQKKLA